MEFSQNVINILTCKTFKGIGTAWIANNIKGNESPETIVALLNSKKSEDDYISLEDFIRVQESIQFDLDKTFSIASNNSRYIDGAVAIGDKNFPIPRGTIKKSEEISLLFYKGDIALLAKNHFNLATIGLLKPSQKIEIRERAIVAELVQHGATIVSGLAHGCDSIAHRECLRSNGQTIAILPSTLNKITPTANKKLAYEIVEKGGLLVTEYYKEPASQKEMISRYIERDRLQALFSDGIVLSASYTENKFGNDSGSRHAMQNAKNYGIPRAVIYDRVQDDNDAQYALNKQIIKEDDRVCVLDEMNMETVKIFVKKAKEQMKPITNQLSLLDYS